MVSSGMCADLLLKQRHLVQTTSIFRAEVALPQMNKGFRKQEEDLSVDQSRSNFSSWRRINPTDVPQPRSDEASPGRECGFDRRRVESRPMLAV